jgi:hypothetical protein
MFGSHRTLKNSTSENASTQIAGDPRRWRTSLSCVPAFRYPSEGRTHCGRTHVHHGYVFAVHVSRRKAKKAPAPSIEKERPLRMRRVMRNGELGTELRRGSEYRCWNCVIVAGGREEDIRSLCELAQAFCFFPMYIGRPGVRLLSPVGGDAYSLEAPWVVVFVGGRDVLRSEGSCAPLGNGAVRAVLMEAVASLRMSEPAVPKHAVAHAGMAREGGRRCPGCASTPASASAPSFASIFSSSSSCVDVTSPTRPRPSLKPHLVLLLWRRAARVGRRLSAGPLGVAFALTALWLVVRRRRYPLRC